MRERRFKIQPYTPSTIPMRRLAQYMDDLAIMLGEYNSVHFSRLDESSAVLVHTIDDEAIPVIDGRVYGVRQGEAPDDAMSAADRISRRLQEDNGTAVYLENTGAELIRFPNREVAEALTFNAFNQLGSVDGIVIRVGGRSDPVPVHIQSVETPTRVINCYAARSIAKELGKHLFGNEMRASGLGRWLRDVDGQWNLERFNITSFEFLNEKPLTSVLAELRAVAGNEWESLPDPWAELNLIRNGPDDTHE